MPDFTQETKTLLGRFAERDHAGVGAPGRTKLLHHGEVRPTSVVLFHGLSASPTQFVRFAHDLHERGHNVVVPRLPRHGHSNRFSDALARLTADDLRTTAQESIALAKGLGERVIVAGFSLGGLLALWTAQQEPVHRAVAISPFLGIALVPNRWMETITETMLKLPNVFPWWDPIARERQLPEHGYPRYATHAIGQMYRLTRDVQKRAAVEPPRAREIVLVSNRMETAVNNRAIARLVDDLRAAGGARVEHVRLTDLPLTHDIIEPNRHVAVADRVYPQLFSIIERGVEP